MCILFIAVEKHPEYPLIIAANRDEFHQRPTQQSHFWEKHPELLGGRDLEAGGSWMGVTRTGRISALTNIRDPSRQLNNAISRGELVTHYLTEGISTEAYAKRIENSAEAYNGYNLLYGSLNPSDLWVFNNHTLRHQQLTPGYYGLSNASLDKPWPKIKRGKQGLADYCESHEHINIDSLFCLLGDKTKAADEELPSTGVPYEWEKQLSSIFIHGESYGTRSSTILTLDHNNHVTWNEHSFDPQGETIAQNQFTFDLKNA
jgi:uncharacterized protein with NRDE domain